MQQDQSLIEPARAIYDTCYTAAPVTFEQARARDLLYYRRAIEAAAKALAAAGPNLAART